MTQNLYYFKQNCKTPKHFEMYKEMPKQPTKKEIKLSSDWYYYLLTTEKNLVLTLYLRGNRWQFRGMKKQIGK
jgi:hypothetical protein